MRAESHNWQYGSGKAHLFNWILWPKWNGWCCNESQLRFFWIVCDILEALPSPYLLCAVNWWQFQTSKSKASYPKWLSLFPHSFFPFVMQSLFYRLPGFLHCHYWGTKTHLLFPLFRNCSEDKVLFLRECQSLSHRSYEETQKEQARRWPDKKDWGK